MSGSNSFTFLGGELCLDFINTANWENAGTPVRFLSSYDSLVEWAAQASIIDRKEAAMLLRYAAARKAKANSVHAAAMCVQEAAYRIIYSRIEGLSPDRKDLDLLNEACRKMLPFRRIEFAGSGFTASFEGSETRLDSVLWPVLRSLRDMLLSERLSRVKRCCGCGWLFLDKSKNTSRRWCTMDVCGNRAKARKHYARLKSAS